MTIKSEAAAPPEALGEQLAEYKALQREVARLLTEKDHIVKSIGPQMEAELELKLGVLHFEAQSLEGEVGRLRRKIDMLLQHYQNGGETPDDELLEAFEVQLEREFAHQREITQHRFEKIVSARLVVDSVLSEEARKRMMKIYRKLAKRLHPVINPDLTPEYKNVWEYVSSAYRNGELEELEALTVLLKELPLDVTGLPDLQQPLAAEQIKDRIENLRDARRRVREQIRSVKQKYPYRLNFKPDEMLGVEDQCREVQEKIGQLTKEKEETERLLQAVLSGAGRNHMH